MRYEVKLTAQAIGQVEEIVQVTAVIYGRRDQIVALTYMLPDDTE